MGRPINRNTPKEPLSTPNRPRGKAGSPDGTGPSGEEPSNAVAVSGEFGFQELDHRMGRRIIVDKRGGQ